MIKKYFYLGAFSLLIIMVILSSGCAKKLEKQIIGKWVIKDVIEKLAFSSELAFSRGKEMEFFSDNTYIIYDEGIINNLSRPWAILDDGRIKIEFSKSTGLGIIKDNQIIIGDNKENRIVLEKKTVK